MTPEIWNLFKIWDYLCPKFHCRINGSYQQQQHPVVSRKYSPSSSGGSSSVAATAAVVASGRSSVVDAPPPLPPPRGGAATHSQPPPTPPRGTTPPPSSSNAMSEWLILSFMPMTYLMNFSFAKDFLVKFPKLGFVANWLFHYSRKIVNSGFTLLLMLVSMFKKSPAPRCLIFRASVCKNELAQNA